MFYSRERTKGKQIVTLRILWHQILLDIWHNGQLFRRASWTNSHPCRNRRRSRFQDLPSALIADSMLSSASRQNTCRGRTTRNIPELSDSIPLTEYFPFRALTPFCDRFHAAASFPSLLLAPLGKVAVGQRKCYLLFREGKTLNCTPGQNQNGGWL
jgi:hypothetical protein